MQLQIKKRVFSLGDRYDILDAGGQPVFQVVSHLFTIGHKLDLLDMAGNALARIQQRLLTLAPEYDIYRDEQLLVVVKKQLFTFFHPRFTVEGPDGYYEMEGDWASWNYRITQSGQTVAQISKEFSLFQDRYGIDIAEGADVPMILCLAIVMDEVAHPDRE